MLSVPDVQDGPAYIGQSWFDEVDLAVLTNVGADSGILYPTTGVVIPHVGGAYSIDVIAHVISYQGNPVEVAAVSSLAPSAASSNDRKDLVQVSGAGVVSIITGNPCSTPAWTPGSGVLGPAKPLPSAGCIPLAELYIPGGFSGNLVANMITDKSGNWNVARPQTFQDPQRRGSASIPNILEGATHEALITAIANTGPTVTFTSTLKPAVGEWVTIANVSDMANINGTWQVTSVTSTTFTVTTGGTPSGSFTPAITAASIGAPSGGFTPITLTVAGTWNVYQSVTLASMTNGAGGANWANMNGTWPLSTGSGTNSLVINIPTASAPTGTFGTGTAQSGVCTVIRPINDVILGDSIPFGEGAGPSGTQGQGISDHWTLVSTMENRYSGLPDPGRGFRRCVGQVLGAFAIFQSDTWKGLGVGAAVSNSGPCATGYTSWATAAISTPISAASMSGQTCTITVAASSFPIQAGGQIVITGATNGGGSNWANINGTWTVLASNEGAGTISFSIGAAAAPSGAYSANSGQINGITDTQPFRRAVVIFKRRTNGDGVQVSFNGGSTATAVLDTNGSGYFMVDSGDLGSIQPRTVQVLQSATHPTGSGGGGVECAGYLCYQTGGATGAYNVMLANAGSTVASWVGNTDWDQIVAMLQPRRVPVCAGVNDLGGGVNATAGTGTTSVTLTLPGIYAAGDTLTVSGGTGTWANVNGTWTATAGSNGSVTFSPSSAVSGAMSGTVNVLQTPAMVFRNLANIVGRIQAASPLSEPVLVAEYHVGNAVNGYTTLISGANWYVSFVSGVKAVADLYQCTFIDLFSVVGDVSQRAGDSGDPYGLSQANGVQGGLGDGIHLGDYQSSPSGRDGQRMLAEHYYNRLVTTHQGVGSQAPGYTTDTNKWTFTAQGSGTSGNQFTVPGNQTGLYIKGLLLRWAEYIVVKYGVVASSSYSTTTNLTTVTMIPTVDYEMIQSPDLGSMWWATSPPPGFPAQFTWTPQLTGFSAQPSVVFAWWRYVAGELEYMVDCFTTGTSNATSLTATLPLVIAPSLSLGLSLGVGSGTDSGASVTVSLSATANSSATVNFYKNVNSGGWTATGAKGVFNQGRVPA